MFRLFSIEPIILAALQKRDESLVRDFWCISCQRRLNEPFAYPIALFTCPLHS